MIAVPSPWFSRIWKNPRIRENQGVGLVLHRKDADIATIHDHNLAAGRLEALPKEGLLHRFVPAPGLGHVVLRGVLVQVEEGSVICLGRLPQRVAMYILSPE
jgi:hypothetical protein